jgi:hypothetical protein
MTRTLVPVWLPLQFSRAQTFALDLVMISSELAALPECPAPCGPFRAKPHVATQCNVLQHNAPCCNMQHHYWSRLRAPQCPRGRKPVRLVTGKLCEYSVRTLTTLCLDTAAEYSASTDARALSAASALLLRWAVRRSVPMCRGGNCRPLHPTRPPGRAAWRGRNVACCMLPDVGCMAYVVRCMVSVARCVLYAAAIDSAALGAQRRGRCGCRSSSNG